MDSEHIEYYCSVLIPFRKRFWQSAALFVIQWHCIKPQICVMSNWYNCNCRGKMKWSILILLVNLRPNSASFSSFASFVSHSCTKNLRITFSVPQQPWNGKDGDWSKATQTVSWLSWSFYREISILPIAILVFAKFADMHPLLCSPGPWARHLLPWSMCWSAFSHSGAFFKNTSGMAQGTCAQPTGHKSKRYRVQS